MPIPRYTTKDLVMFSTVIAFAARQSDWGSELPDEAGHSGSQTVMEVQCMILGRTGLYVACNGGEHLAVQHFFSAFGVIDHASLIQCLRYALFLLRLPHPQKPVVGRNYTVTPLGDEGTNISSGDEKKYLPPLTADEIKRVRDLVSSQTEPAAEDKQLAWFLKKFTQAKKLPGLSRPVSDQISWVQRTNREKTLSWSVPGAPRTQS